MTGWIALDHAATTPIAPEVLEAMLPWLRDGWGNPSSDHGPGREARAAVELARSQVAGLLGASADEVVFTSGGTEADHLAVLGVAGASRRRTLVTTRVEHPAVLAPCERLAEAGWRCAALAPDARGVVPVAAFADTIDDDTALVSVMLANNETGVLQPVGEVSPLARARGALLHTDAAQAVGRVPIDVDALGVDLLTAVGHKVYGPKGVGALYVRRGVALAPQQRGGGQERGLRAGTENVASIVGFGEACALAGRRLADDALRLAELRDRLATALRAGVPGLRVTGEGAPRLSNVLHVRFPGRIGSQVLADAGGIAASTGSACHAGQVTASAVLRAMGLDEADAVGAVRLSLGRSTTRAEIDEAARRLTSSCLEPPSPTRPGRGQR